MNAGTILVFPIVEPAIGKISIGTFVVLQFGLYVINLVYELDISYIRIIGFRLWADGILSLHLHKALFFIHKL